MSRSLHTQKLSVRAVRRLARPFSKRRDEARYLDGTHNKETNVVRLRGVSSRRVPKVEAASTRVHIAAHGRPVILNRKPHRGLWHVLTPADIRAYLAALGPACMYGLRTLCLRSESAMRPAGVVFAEYSLCGDIYIYALPGLLWRLPYHLAPEDIEAFKLYGASVLSDVASNWTTVRWSAEGLREFALHEVLAHELGHHMLQRKKGKQYTLVCRRGDHERLADLFSRRALKQARGGAAR